MKTNLELISEIDLRLGRLTEKVMKEVLGERIEVFGKISSLSWFKVISTVGSDKSNRMLYADIVAETGLAKSTLSILLGNLEEKGLVIKDADQTNKKYTYISLTKLGKEFIGVYDEINKKIDNIIFEGLDIKQSKQFNKTLDIIAENLKK